MGRQAIAHDATCLICRSATVMGDHVSVKLSDDARSAEGVLLQAFDVYVELILSARHGDADGKAHHSSWHVVADK